MTTYSWPTAADWKPNRFRMWVKPNDRLFDGYYSGQTQALDLLGECWMCVLSLPPCQELQGASREAYFNRLHGRTNLISLWHMLRPAPVGTMRGTPTISGSVAQLASTINIQSSASATLIAGDMIGLGGQVSQVMANATANGSGLFSGVEIWPRARTAISSGAAVTWDKPPVNFRLADGDGVPIDWGLAGNADGVTVNLAEV